jgi:hypothetical protein
MPIYLPAPSHDPKGPDGKGWNRLSLNAHMGSFGAQCALLPKFYSNLVESLDTRRAHWGGYGHCIRRGECEGCPVWTADDAEETVPFTAPRVLVRIDTEIIGEMFTAAPLSRLWMTDQPDSPDFRKPEHEWDFARIRRLLGCGWELGRPYRDQHGEGFWLHRVDAVPEPPAPHVTVRTKTYDSGKGHARHAFRVPGGRPALLVCPSTGCRHGQRMLDALTRHVPERSDEEALPLTRAEVEHLGGRPSLIPTDTVNGWSLRADCSPYNLYSLTITAHHPDEQSPRLILAGSTWSRRAIHAAATTLLTHLTPPGAPTAADAG